jgi:hypothetical protein
VVLNKTQQTLGGVIQDWGEHEQFEAGIGQKTGGVIKFIRSLNQPNECLDLDRVLAIHSLVMLCIVGF